jgi:hypothetical protein
MHRKPKTVAFSFDRLIRHAAARRIRSCSFGFDREVFGMPAFMTLWSNHPTVKREPPLLDKKVYENQCAISLSAALIRSGINMKSYTGAWSWQKDKPKYAIRAQELADWLATPASQLATKVQKFGGKGVFDKINLRSGIVFFRNYWGAGNQGDHIDLWNGHRLTDWFTWVRIHARIGSFGVHSVAPLSDFEESQSVWFWALP